MIAPDDQALCYQLRSCDVCCLAGLYVHASVCTCLLHHDCPVTNVTRCLQQAFRHSMSSDSDFEGAHGMPCTGVHHAPRSLRGSACPHMACPYSSGLLPSPFTAPPRPFPLHQHRSSSPNFHSRQIPLLLLPPPAPCPCHLLVGGPPSAALPHCQHQQCCAVRQLMWGDPAPQQPDSLQPHTPQCA